MFPERVENIVGKGENAGYHHFPVVQQCFLEVVNSQYCLVNPLPHNSNF